MGAESEHPWAFRKQREELQLAKAREERCLELGSFLSQLLPGDQAVI